ncbi:unnamed protein product, partial [Closterium sp. Naga37s-1]
GLDAALSSYPRARGSLQTPSKGGEDTKPPMMLCECRGHFKREWGTQAAQECFGKKGVMVARKERQNGQEAVARGGGNMAGGAGGVCVSFPRVHADWAHRLMRRSELAEAEGGRQVWWEGKVQRGLQLRKEGQEGQEVRGLPGGPLAAPPGFISCVSEMVVGARWWWERDGGGSEMVVGARWWWERDGGGSEMVVGARWWWERDGGGSEMVVGARWWWERDGGGSEMVVGARWWWERDGGGSEMVVGARWWWERDGGGSEMVVGARWWWERDGGGRRPSESL